MANKHSQLETRLRNEAAQWADHVSAGGKSVVPASGRIAENTPTLNWYQAASIAAGITLMFVGGWLLSGNFSPEGTSSQQAMSETPSPLVSGRVLDPTSDANPDAHGVDLETLQVTNRALQSVIARAARGTQDAVELSINEIAVLDSTASLGELSQSSSQAIRNWAREPGRQYGAAAKWFDGSLLALSDSSVETARRMLFSDKPLAP
ncbi:MAG TPA: hypothetical protein DDW52_26665 [Planctomycetaceae bacterium]|nr:hypothetical protein [Planctomycetaceae bacterium]